MIYVILFPSLQMAAWTHVLTTKRQKSDPFPLKQPVSVQKETKKGHNRRHYKRKARQSKDQKDAKQPQPVSIVHVPVTGLLPRSDLLPAADLQSITKIQLAQPIYVSSDANTNESARTISTAEPTVESTFYTPQEDQPSDPPSAQVVEEAEKKKSTPHNTPFSGAVRSTSLTLPSPLLLTTKEPIASIPPAPSSLPPAAAWLGPTVSSLFSHDMTHPAGSDGKAVTRPSAFTKPNDAKVGSRTSSAHHSPELVNPVVTIRSMPSLTVSTSISLKEHADEMERLHIHIARLQLHVQELGTYVTELRDSRDLLAEQLLIADQTISELRKENVLLREQAK
jgi:hypothetical protein